MLLCSPAPFSSVWLCEGRCRKDGEMHQPNWSQVQAAADLDPKRTQPKIGSDRETCSHSKLFESGSKPPGFHIEFHGRDLPVLLCCRMSDVVGKFLVLEGSAPCHGCSCRARSRTSASGGFRGKEFSLKTACVTMRTILDVLGRCQCTLGSKIKMEGSSKTKETAADLDNRVRWSESATDMTDMPAKVQMSSTDGYGDQW